MTDDVCAGNTVSFEPLPCILESSQFKNAKSLCARLQAEGFEAYFVGGVVRDFFLKPESIPTDFDIATSAEFEDLEIIFSSVCVTGRHFGVCRLQYENMVFEVATFREDGNYTDNRRPEWIKKSDMRKDSLRRDFTINAIYFDPCRNLIFDFHEGLTDLKFKRLRTVGNATERFHEDALRILRFFRFQLEFGFSSDKETESAIDFAKPLLNKISLERKYTEIVKLSPQHFLTMMNGFIINSFLIPLFPFLENFQGKFLPCDDVNVFKNIDQKLYKKLIVLLTSLHIVLSAKENLSSEVLTLWNVLEKKCLWTRKEKMMFENIKIFHLKMTANFAELTEDKVIFNLIISLQKCLRFEEQEWLFYKKVLFYFIELEKNKMPSLNHHFLKVIERKFSQSYFLKSAKKANMRIKDWLLENHLSDVHFRTVLNFIYFKALKNNDDDIFENRENWFDSAEFEKMKNQLG